MKFVSSRRFWRAVTLMILMFGGCAERLYAQAGSAGDVDLIYSADDGLCSGITGKLNEIRKKVPAATYLSQARSIFFHDGTFSPPAWINHPDPDLGSAFDAYDGDPTPELDGFRNDGLGYWFGQAFFRADVFADGREHLVLVGHDALGHNGDYATHFVIFKAGMPYATLTAKTSDARDDEPRIDPDLVDMTIGVTGNMTVNFPRIPTPSGIAEKLKALMTDKGSQLPPQEPFFYKNRLFFLLGTPLVDDGLVYRILSKNNINLMCLVARKKLNK
ncbi:hypothetical protein [Burkholderia plantarii]|uniref:hypothetical protein n=1 Tax=Burkholderia plantarii TaxID=41899 RepID=UPI00130ED070|nr:hypothetical protein [Burkholderia plantarii]